MGDSVDDYSDFFVVQDETIYIDAPYDSDAELSEDDLARDPAFLEDLHEVLAAIKERDQSAIKALGSCKGRCGRYGRRYNFLHIKEVMEVIRRSGSAVRGQTWMLCKVCNCISTCLKFGNNFRASFSGPRKDCNLGESTFTLKAEEGIVGKAASSRHHIVYCEDISKLKFKEYPLTHIAPKYYHFSCCAISLQSIYTGDQIYVIEFFQDPSRDFWAALASIFQAMRQNFRTFKLSSGKEFGGTLSVQIIDASSPDKIAILENWLPDLTLRIGVNNVKVLRPYFLQGSIGETSIYGTDDSMAGMETSIQDTSMEEAHGQSFSTVKSEFCMTVKVYYGDDFITFQLSDSSGIDTLKELVSQRFKLENGTYRIMYQDEANDPVLIECDEDVHEYISCSTSFGVYLLSIELKDS